MTQTGRRATEILAGVSDCLGSEFVPPDRNHGYFRIDDVGPKRAFTKVRAAFDAVSTRVSRWLPSATGGGDTRTHDRCDRRRNGRERDG